VGDSMLVVRQVEGRFKVKNAGLKKLHAEVKKALAGFDSWSIRHVRRAENADADRLVNEAFDGVLDG
ncbi:MAG TPA: reverse transcriptase-like protein, partial [Solirubrobacterales bacterium]